MKYQVDPFAWQNDNSDITSDFFLGILKLLGILAVVIVIIAAIVVAIIFGIRKTYVAQTNTAPIPQYAYNSDGTIAGIGYVPVARNNSEQNPEISEQNTIVPVSEYDHNGNYVGVPNLPKRAVENAGTWGDMVNSKPARTFGKIAGWTALALVSSSLDHREEKRTKSEQWGRANDERIRQDQIEANRNYDRRERQKEQDRKNRGWQKKRDELRDLQLDEARDRDFERRRWF